MSPPTLTKEPGPKLMPAGLFRMIRPFAVIWPRMAEALPPVTVFTATDMAPGWRKRTSSFAPTLKPFQLMRTLAVNCWIWIVLGLTWEMAALPDTTCPPWGRAAAGPAKSSPARIADKVRLNEGTRGGMEMPLRPSKYSAVPSEEN